MGDDLTADALEADLLGYGVDLLDLYRGTLTYRRVCVLVANLPDNAALWRVMDPHGVHSRTDLLLVALERRVTVLWATVAAALGHQVPAEHLTGPLDALAESRSDTDPQPETPSLREIAVWMRG